MMVWAARSFYRVSVFSKIELASKHLNERIKKGASPEDAWNETSIELVAAAEVVISTLNDT